MAYTCVRCVCTVRCETNSRAAMSLLPSPSLTSRTTSSSVGVKRFPSGRRPLTLPVTALCVSDRLLKRQRRSFGPRGVEVVVAQYIANCREQRHIHFVVDREPDHAAHSVPNRLRRTAKPGRFTMTSGRTGHFGEDLQRIRNDLIGLDLGGARQARRGRHIQPAPCHPARSQHERGSSMPSPGANPSSARPHHRLAVSPSSVLHGGARAPPSV